VSRVVKVVVWVAVFAACAGAGAFLASRTNPFPPGVADPGARPTDGPGVPAERVWHGVGSIRTRHELFVGGSCRTDWRIRITASATDGDLDGQGVARLVGEARCDVPNAQRQSRTISLTVEGRLRGDRMTIRLSEVDRAPEGSIDLGGLSATLDRTVIRMIVRDAVPVTEGEWSVSVPDTDRGSYEADGTIELSAVA
jgi:hypothetical protein